jgi:hypothetical protein
MATMRKTAFNNATNAANQSADYSKNIADQMMQGIGYQQALYNTLIENAGSQQEYVAQQQQDIAKKTANSMQQGQATMANQGFTPEDAAFQQQQAQYATAGATAQNAVAQKASQQHYENMLSALGGYGSTINQMAGAAGVGQAGYNSQIEAGNAAIGNANQRANNIIQGAGLIASIFKPISGGGSSSSTPAKP